MIVALGVAVLLAGDSSRAFAPARLGPEPLREFVDLGPVAVPNVVADRRRFDRLLQLEGDRLDADGFFITEGDPAGIYAPGMNVSLGLFSGLLGPFALVPALFELAITPQPTHTVVLRAYTFRDLPAKTRQRLLEISRQVVVGEMSVADFEAERERLLTN
ncbi:MAG: hypothetical protein ACAI38_16560 [Myxococcota bacterium]|nr:hypothetical protein [Myxococcota bacterium]